MPHFCRNQDVYGRRRPGDAKDGEASKKSSPRASRAESSGSRSASRSNHRVTSRDRPVRSGRSVTRDRDRMERMERRRSRSRISRKSRRSERARRSKSSRSISRSRQRKERKRSEGEHGEAKENVPRKDRKEINENDKEKLQTKVPEQPATETDEPKVAPTPGWAARVADGGLLGMAARQQSRETSSRLGTAAGQAGRNVIKKMYCNCKGRQTSHDDDDDDDEEDDEDEDEDYGIILY